MQGTNGSNGCSVVPRLQCWQEWPERSTPAMTDECIRSEHNGNHHGWRKYRRIYYCWWFRNPANQLRLVVYPIIYRVSYIPGGARFLPSTVVCALSTLQSVLRKVAIVSMLHCKHKNWEQQTNHLDFLNQTWWSRDYKRPNNCHACGVIYMCIYIYIDKSVSP